MQSRSASRPPTLLLVPQIRSACDTPQVMGATLGIIGYGDIGQAAAVKAKAMGMKIVAQRRRPEMSSGDGIADEVLGAGQVPETLFYHFFFTICFLVRYTWYCRA